MNPLSIQASNQTSCACNLTTEAFAIRKQTIIAELKKEVLESKETDRGFAYKFYGSDPVVDRLFDFIKTERQCCEFFMFNLFISRATEFVWLEISGPAGSKEFIKTELEL